MLKRFTVTGHNGGFGPINFKLDPKGDLVLLAQMQGAINPLISVAREIDLYGADISRLRELSEALAHMDNELTPLRPTSK